MFHLYNKDDLMSKHEQSQEKFPLLSSPNITRHTKCLTWEMCEIIKRWRKYLLRAPPPPCLKPHLILFILPNKQRSHMGRQHVLQQQAVQVLPGLNLVLFCAILILKQEVLAEAGFILADRNTVRSEKTIKETVTWNYFHWSNNISNKKCDFSIWTWTCRDSICTFLFLIWFQFFNLGCEGQKWKRNETRTDLCNYLLCNDEHSDQEEGDIYAAHHLGVFYQPYRSQDWCIFYAVRTEHLLPFPCFIHKYSV